MVLGSLVEGSFIAKAEIADWPFFGTLCRMARTVFVMRHGSRAAQQRDEIAARLEEHDNLILFPEGTSNDGLHVLPFKSALFAVAEARDGRPPVTVQPVSIAYTRLDGIPLVRNMRPHFAWYGDMHLVPHMLTLLGLGTVTAHVVFHEPIPGDAVSSRKELAERCRRAVVAGVNAANRGAYDVDGATKLPYSARSEPRLISVFGRLSAIDYCPVGATVDHRKPHCGAFPDPKTGARPFDVGLNFGEKGLYQELRLSDERL